MKERPVAKRSSPEFKWNPTDYENVERVLSTAPSMVLETIAGAIRVYGGPLSCPAPSSDPLGSYQVALDAARQKPVIQKLDADGETWKTIVASNARTMALGEQQPDWPEYKPAQDQPGAANTQHPDWVEYKPQE